MIESLRISGGGGSGGGSGGGRSGLGVRLLWAGIIAV
jgi:hypothetical protein